MPLRCEPERRRSDRPFLYALGVPPPLALTRRRRFAALPSGASLGPQALLTARGELLLLAWGPAPARGSRLPPLADEGESILRPCAARATLRCFLPRCSRRVASSFHCSRRTATTRSCPTMRSSAAGRTPTTRPRRRSSAPSGGPTGLCTRIASRLVPFRAT